MTYDSEENNNWPHKLLDETGLELVGCMGKIYRPVRQVYSRNELEIKSSKTRSQESITRVED